MRDATTIVFVRPREFVIPTYKRNADGIYFGDWPVDVFDAEQIVRAADSVWRRLVEGNPFGGVRNLKYDPATAILEATCCGSWRKFNIDTGSVGFTLTSQLSVDWIRRLSAKGRAGYEPVKYWSGEPSPEAVLQQLTELTALIRSRP